MDFKDYYATLGVPKGATGKEIKQAFRKLARKHHPDVNPGDKAAESRFKELNEAYEVLGDAAKRKKYDELGSNWRMYEQAGPQGGPQGASPFGTRPPGGGGFRTMTPEDMQDMFGDSDPFSDFFHTFFGGEATGPDVRGGRAGRKAPRKGRDFEDEIQLDLEDAYRGATRRLTIKQDGHARSVDVRIPAGVNDGSRVRVPGEGEHGATGAQAGDLYLRIRLAPHAQFDRKGSDLYTRVAVPLTTAVLGGEVEVPTLSGKSLRLKVPTTTQGGQVFRLKGHGMPVVGKPEERGDLYATAEVELPRQLTPEERTHFEALQRLEANKSPVA
ncbi:MAG: DnaJ C-terminal domain-containing protein [Acidobacteriota bacterium]